MGIDISKEMETWLAGSAELHDWASSYLLKRELKAPGSTGYYSKTTIWEWVRQLPSTPETTRLLDDMMQAWAMKERRRRNTDKKPCSFELSTEAKSQLNYLAAREGKTKTAMLEQLLKQAAGKAKKHEMKSEKKLATQIVKPKRIDLSQMTVGDFLEGQKKSITEMTVEDLIK